MNYKWLAQDHLENEEKKNKQTEFKPQSFLLSINWVFSNMALFS